ncbi:MAG: acyltransferase [Syntrophomonas sp.]
MRKNYIDNIRWLVIMIVPFYHTTVIFNSFGLSFNINHPGVPAMDSFIFFFTSWLMPLLFVLAGISVYYALKNRSAGQFFNNRLTKLLLPFTAGYILINPVQSYFTYKYHNDYTGSFFPSYLSFVADPNTIGQLWFLLELFFLSLIFLPLFMLLKKHGKFYNLCGKTRLWLLLLFYFPILGASYLFNYPFPVFKTGLYGLLFLLGFFIFSFDSVIEQLSRFRKPLVVIAVFLNAFYAFSVVSQICGNTYLWTQILYYEKPVQMALCWITILAVLAAAPKYLNFSNRFSAYMNKASFPVYIFHQSLLLLITDRVLHWNLPIILDYFVIGILCYIASFAAFELVRRIPGLRYLFAIK